jgi:hypothetical protein
MANQNKTTRYHCVEIVGGPEACAAVKLLAKQRILSGDAPLLPLDDCDRVDHCECIYLHFHDRRQGPRRSQVVRKEIVGTPAYKGRERRIGRGRRETDWD